MAYGQFQHLIAALYSLHHLNHLYPVTCPLFLCHLFYFPNQVLNSCEATEIKSTGKEKTEGIKNNDRKSN